MSICLQLPESRRGSEISHTTRNSGNEMGVQSSPDDPWDGKLSPFGDKITLRETGTHTGSNARH